MTVALKNVSKTATKTNQKEINMSKLYDTILQNPIFTPALKEQIAEVITEQSVTEQYVDKIVRGVYKHGLLRGAPGLGKSFAVANALRRAGKIEGKDYVILKGHCTPLQLFLTLYAFRAPGKFVVLDDCDVEHDPTGMDVIKAATDVDSKRVCWGSTRSPIVNGQIVDEFTFKGTMIICTNVFASSGKGVKSAKVEAILSRMIPRTVDWATREKKFAQIFNMVVNADYLNNNPDTALTDTQKEDMLTFILENLDDINALDLRLPQKIAANIRDGGNWKKFCRISLIGV